jgi:hypothetical protein
VLSNPIANPRQLEPIMGLMISCFVRAMAFQSTTNFLPSSRWFMGSLEFLTNKFGNESLQESESSDFIVSCTDCLRPAPVRVGLINEAHLKHRLDLLGGIEIDSIGDKADHALAVPAAAIDPICMSSLESDSKYGREIYMVEQGGELLEKTTKEIQREAEEEIARVERLARELDKRKGHIGLQEDSGGSEDERRDGPPSRRRHSRFDSRCHNNRE